jgi:hypothetical protein
MLIKFLQIHVLKIIKMLQPTGSDLLLPLGRFFGGQSLPHRALCLS